MPLQSWDSKENKLSALWVVPQKVEINHYPSPHVGLGGRKFRNSFELKTTFIEHLLAQDGPGTYGAIFCLGI